MSSSPPCPGHLLSMRKGALGGGEMSTELNALRHLSRGLFDLPFQPTLPQLPVNNCCGLGLARPLPRWLAGWRSTPPWCQPHHPCPWGSSVAPPQPPTPRRVSPAITLPVSSGSSCTGEEKGLLPLAVWCWCCTHSHRTPAAFTVSCRGCR